MEGKQDDVSSSSVPPPAGTAAAARAGINERMTDATKKKKATTTKTKIKTKSEITTIATSSSEEGTVASQQQLPTTSIAATSTSSSSRSTTNATTTAAAAAAATTPTTTGSSSLRQRPIGIASKRQRGSESSVSSSGQGRLRTNVWSTGNAERAASSSRSSGGGISSGGGVVSSPPPPPPPALTRPTTSTGSSVPAAIRKGGGGGRPIRFRSGEVSTAGAGIGRAASSSTALSSTSAAATGSITRSRRSYRQPDVTLVTPPRSAYNAPIAVTGSGGRRRRLPPDPIGASSGEITSTSGTSSSSAKPTGSSSSLGPNRYNEPRTGINQGNGGMPMTGSRYPAQSGGARQRRSHQHNDTIIALRGASAGGGAVRVAHRRKADNAMMITAATTSGDVVDSNSNISNSNGSNSNDSLLLSPLGPEESSGPTGNTQSGGSVVVSLRQSRYYNAVAAASKSGAGPDAGHGRVGAATSNTQEQQQERLRHDDDENHHHHTSAARNHHVSRRIIVRSGATNGNGIPVNNTSTTGSGVMVTSSSSSLGGVAAEGGEEEDGAVVLFARNDNYNNVDDTDNATCASNLTAGLGQTALARGERVQPPPTRPGAVSVVPPTLFASVASSRSEEEDDAMSSSHVEVSTTTASGIHENPQQAAAAPHVITSARLVVENDINIMNEELIQRRIDEQVDARLEQQRNELVTAQVVGRSGDAGQRRAATEAAAPAGNTAAASLETGDENNDDDDDAPLLLRRVFCIGCIAIVILVAIASSTVVGIVAALQKRSNNNGSGTGGQKQGQQQEENTTNNNLPTLPLADNDKGGAVATTQPTTQTPNTTTISPSTKTPMLPTRAVPSGVQPSSVPSRAPTGVPTGVSTATTRTTTPTVVPLPLIGGASPTNNPRGTTTTAPGPDDAEDGSTILRPTPQPRPTSSDQQLQQECASGHYYYAYFEGASSPGSTIGMFDLVRSPGNTTAEITTTAGCDIFALTFDRKGSAHAQCGKDFSNNAFVKVDLSTGTTTEIAVLPWQDFNAVMAYNPVDDHFYSIHKHIEDYADEDFDLVKLSTTATGEEDNNAVAITVLGSVAVDPGFHALAFDSNGVAFGSNGRSLLYSLNLENGTPEPLSGPSVQGAILLGFDVHGVLHAMGMDGDQPLFTIEVNNGTAFTTTQTGVSLNLYLTAGAFCPL